MLWSPKHEEDPSSEQTSEDKAPAHMSDWQHEFVVASRRKVQQYCEAKGVDSKSIVVEPFLSKYMREHQRQGVQFMFDCVTGIRPADGFGCILADDMVLIQPDFSQILSCHYPVSFSLLYSGTWKNLSEYCSDVYVTYSRQEWFASDSESSGGKSHFKTLFKS